MIKKYDQNKMAEYSNSDRLMASYGGIYLIRKFEAIFLNDRTDDKSLHVPLHRPI